MRSTSVPELETTPAYSLTNYTFTGQFSYMDDPSTSEVTEGFGLMYYNARWYDPYLNCGQFLNIALSQVDIRAQKYYDYFHNQTGSLSTG